MNFFSNLFLNIDATLDQFYVDKIQTVMDFVAPVIPILAVILIVGIGIGLMFGIISQDAKPLIMGALTIVIVSLLAGNVGIYNLYLADLLRGLPNDLIALSSDSGVGTVGTKLDEFGDLLLSAINQLWANASGISETAAVAVICAIFFIAWVAMSASAAFSILMAKIVLTILVTAGPLFIVFLLFKQTQDYFSKWLTYCISFSLLAMVVGGIISATNKIATTYFTQFLDDSTKVDFTLFAAPMLILFGLWKLFESAPSIASSVAGGIGLSASSGIANAVQRTVSPVTTGARLAYNRTIGEERQSQRNVRMQARQTRIRTANREADQAKQAKKMPKSHT